MKDKLTDEILFYFALKSGLLFKSLTDASYNLTEIEQQIVELYLEAYFDKENKLAYTPEEIFTWYVDEKLDYDKIDHAINQQIEIKNQAKSDALSTEDSSNIERVSQTFPGLVITHFCKNVNTSFDEELSFPLGFYVFWEIIVKIIMRISEFLGFEYVYIFAADNTKNSKDDVKTDTSYIDFFKDIDEGSKSTEDIKATLRLVDYYRNEFKFEPIHDLTVLKPYYDFRCHTLFQKVSDLLINRSIAWAQISNLSSN